MYFWAKTAGFGSFDGGWFGRQDEIGSRVTTRGPGWVRRGHLSDLRVLSDFCGSMVKSGLQER